MLFALLGSQRWEVREAASEMLSTMPAPVFHLEALRLHPDAEVRLRVQRLREQHIDALLEMVLGSERAPWIDSLPKNLVDRDSIIHVWLGALGCGRYRTGEFPVYSGATACWLRSQLEDGLSVTDGRKMVRRMRDREPFWKDGRWTDE